MDVARVALAAATAMVLVFIELDRDFYVPRGARAKVASWWGLFIVGNGSIAGICYHAVGSISSIAAIDPWLLAVMVGAVYQAILRAKITTIKYEGKDIPFGFELVYNAIRGYFYKKINDAIKQERAKETTRKANAHSLQELANEALGAIRADNLFTADEKTAEFAWVRKVLEDARNSPDDQPARETLASYILSGRK